MEDQRTKRQRSPDDPEPIRDPEPAWEQSLPAAPRVLTAVERRLITPDEVGESVSETDGPIAVRSYYDTYTFEADAAEFARAGFFPVAVTNQPQRAGPWRILSIGFFALLWQPKPHLVVTYKRET